MKANELMIGNLVKYQSKIIKIEQITKRKVGYHIQANEHRMHYVRLCEVEPIPITEELLSMNGFTSNGLAQFYIHLNDEYETAIRTGVLDGNRYVVFIESKKYYDFYCIEVTNHNIYYLHEFQNTLRLAGIELEFKV